MDAELLSRIAVRMQESPGNFLPTSEGYYPFRAIDFNALRKSAALAADPETEVTYPCAVEPLLAEALTLLERCLANRAAKQELEVQALNLWLELESFGLHDQVQDERVAAGAFEVPVASAKAEWDALTVGEPALQAAYDHAREGARIFQPKEKEFKEFVGASAEAAYLACASTRADDLTAVALKVESSRLRYNAPAAGIQEQQSNHALLSAQAKAAAAELQYRFESVDRTLKLKDLKIDREIIGHKHRLVREPSSSLNYAARIADVQRVFDADFASMIKRLRAVEVGLGGVYGLAGKLPVITDEASISALAQWARRQVDRLAKISEATIVLDRAVSIKARVAEASWIAFLGGAELSFDITPDDVPDCRFVRLRKLGMVQRRTTSTSARGFVLSLPADGACGGPSPRVLLGNVRVAEHQPASSVEARYFFNRSPFGTWKIRSIKADSVKLGALDCDDLELDLGIAVCPV